MGFPDKWSEIVGHSKASRIKGTGNAVVPQVAEWIGRRIVEVFDAAD